MGSLIAVEFENTLERYIDSKKNYCIINLILVNEEDEIPFQDPIELRFSKREYNYILLLQQLYGYNKSEIDGEFIKYCLSEFYKDIKRR